MQEGRNPGSFVAGCLPISSWFSLPPKPKRFEPCIARIRAEIIATDEFEYPRGSALSAVLNFIPSQLTGSLRSELQTRSRARSRCPVFLFLQPRLELRLNALIACQKWKASRQGSPVERAQDPGHRCAVIAELKEPAELWSGKLPADRGLVEQLVEMTIPRGPRPYAF